MAREGMGGPRGAIQSSASREPGSSPARRQATAEPSGASSSQAGRRRNLEQMPAALKMGGLRASRQGDGCARLRARHPPSSSSTARARTLPMPATEPATMRRPLLSASLQALAWRRRRSQQQPQEQPRRAAQQAYLPAAWEWMDGRPGARPKPWPASRRCARSFLWRAIPGRLYGIA